MNRYCWQLAAKVAGLLDKGITRTLFASGAKHSVAQRGPKKCRRVDHDIAFKSVFEALQAKKFRSPGAVARAEDWDESVRRAQEQHNLQMMNYLQESHNAFKNKKQLQMALDASTCGGESTMLSAIVDPSTQTACWGVPQAMHGHPTLGPT